MSVDELFAKITRSEQRAAAKSRKHEYKMAMIDGMDGEDRLGYIAIRALRTFLIVLTLTIGGCAGAESIANTPVQQQQYTACEKAATAARMFADCDMYDIRITDKKQ